MCSSHFVRPEGMKEVLHSLSLALTLTLTLNHFANEPLQRATKQSDLVYLTYGSVTDYKYLIRCTTNYIK